MGLNGTLCGKPVNIVSSLAFHGSNLREKKNKTKSREFNANGRSFPEPKNV